MPQDTDPRKRKIRQRLRAAGLEGDRLDRSVEVAARGLSKSRNVLIKGEEGPGSRDPMIRAEEIRRRRLSGGGS